MSKPINNFSWNYFLTYQLLIIISDTKCNYFKIQKLNLAQKETLKMWHLFYKSSYNNLENLKTTRKIVEHTKKLINKNFF